MSCDALNWLNWAVLNVLSSFELIRSETNFHCFFSLRMSCDAPNVFNWAVMNVLSSFELIRSEKTFHCSSLAQNKLWCSKWLNWAILKVLSSFELIRSETNFHCFFSLRMSCDAPNGLTERAVMNVLSSFELIRSEKNCIVSLAQNELWCSKWLNLAVHERFVKFWAHSERKNTIHFLLSLTMSCDALKWLNWAVRNVLSSFEIIRSEKTFHFLL